MHATTTYPMSVLTRMLSVFVFTMATTTTVRLPLYACCTSNSQAAHNLDLHSVAHRNCQTRFSTEQTILLRGEFLLSFQSTANTLRMLNQSRDLTTTALCFAASAPAGLCASPWLTRSCSTRLCRRRAWVLTSASRRPRPAWRATMSRYARAPPRLNPFPVPFGTEEP